MHVFRNNCEPLRCKFLCISLIIKNRFDFVADRQHRNSSAVRNDAYILKLPIQVLVHKYIQR